MMVVTTPVFSVSLWLKLTLFTHDSKTMNFSYFLTSLQHPQYHDIVNIHMQPKQNCVHTVVRNGYGIEGEREFETLRHTSLRILKPNEFKEEFACEIP
jgi:hypothetical protein